MATERPHRRSGPPDFVGVGAQRCGTTWWFGVLGRHPQVRRPRERRKELHFFDAFGAREMTDADVRRYHALFRRKDGELSGEWTPRYMRDFWTPPLLARVAPDARLLVLLRDPVERYRSGVLHRLSRTPDRQPEALASDAIERGRFSRQLRRLHRHFPRERILVLQYERCRADPHAEYVRTLRFLGLPDPENPPDFEQARGTTMSPAKRELWPDFVRAMQEALEEDVAELPTLAEDLDLGLWPNFAHLA
jgi:hypothetical protein